MGDQLVISGCGHIAFRLGEEGVLRKLSVTAALFALSSCIGPSWPEAHFPEELRVQRILFANSSYGLREGCEAMIAEITDASATRLIKLRGSKSRLEIAPPDGGWKSTPVPKLDADPAYYQGAFDGCSTDGREPLGNLPGALDRPGSFYKFINNGEGIAIIGPRAKLAGYFYVG